LKAKACVGANEAFEREVFVIVGIELPGTTVHNVMAFHVKQKTINR
jgi:hypothetical protein